MKGKKSIGACAGALCLCALLLAGCGGDKKPDAVTAPAISVSDKGVITSYLVGEFSEDYYELNGLSDMVMSEAAAYNENHKTESGAAPVTVLSVERPEEDPSKAVVVLEYDSDDTYRAYTGMDLFYGTVAEAREQGYGLNVELVSAKKGEESAGEAELAKMDKNHILIVQEKVNVVCPRAVKYYSAGAAGNPDGSVNLSGAEDDPAYILMK